MVLCLGVAAAALIEAYRLGSVQFPAGCVTGGYSGPSFDPSAPPTPCNLASQRFSGIAWSFDMGLVRMFEQILPFIVGITFGAVLVAKEIEEGTAPLSWALAGSRRRWLLGKLLAVIVVIVPLLLIAGLAADVRQGAMVQGGSDSHASFDYYADRGVFFVLWGLAALCGTVALGAFTGRTMPALFVALIVCVFARGLWEQAWNQTVLRQFAVRADQGAERGDLSLYQTSELYLDGKLWVGDFDAWWQAHETCTEVKPDPSLPASAGGMVCQPTADATMPPMPATYVIHGDRYWQIVALESPVLLGGAIVFSGVALFWVGRRRPY